MAVSKYSKRGCDSRNEVIVQLNKKGGGRVGVNQDLKVLYNIKEKNGEG